MTVVYLRALFVLQKISKKSLMHQMASKFDAEMNALMNFYYPYIHPIHIRIWFLFIDFESNSSRIFFLQLLHCQRIKYMSNIMRLTGFKLASDIFFSPNHYLV